MESPVDVTPRNLRSLVILSEATGLGQRSIPVPRYAHRPLRQVHCEPRADPSGRDRQTRRRQRSPRVTGNPGLERRRGDRYDRRSNAGGKAEPRLRALAWTINPPGAFITENWSLPSYRAGISARAMPADAVRGLSLAEDSESYYEQTLSTALRTTRPRPCTRLSTMHAERLDLRLETRCAVAITHSPRPGQECGSRSRAS